MKHDIWNSSMYGTNDNRSIFREPIVRSDYVHSRDWAYRKSGMPVTEYFVGAVTAEALGNSCVP